MHGIPPEDPGRNHNWSLTARDYAQHRPGYPASFYQRLQVLGVGLPGQRVLDLGTGTGTVARNLAQRGCQVTGIDPAPGLLEAARSLARAQDLEVEFLQARAEETGLPSRSFDVVTASQCWLYFDCDAAIREVRRLLAPGGILVTWHLSWLPGSEPVNRTEALVREFNPAWGGGQWSGEVPPVPAWMGKGFRQVGMFVYDQDLSFSRESWRGRIRACRGVGASLTDGEITRFDQKLAQFLENEHPQEFLVPHRIDAHLLMAR